MTEQHKTKCPKCGRRLVVKDYRVGPGRPGMGQDRPNPIESTKMRECTNPGCDFEERAE